MTPTETTRVREARREDVIEEIRARLPIEGQKVTVRDAGHGLYGRARRAFGGSWSAAIEAAGREASAENRGFGGDATELFKNLDAISANPLPGLPRHLRERQILGGMMLERFAKTAEQARRPHVVHDLGMGEEAIGASSSAERMLGQALLWSINRYRLLTIKPDRAALTQQLAASEDGSVVAEKRYDLGDDTGGDLELAEHAPVEHRDG